MTRYIARVSAYATMTGRFIVDADTPEQAAELAAVMLLGDVDPEWEYVDGSRPAPGSATVDEIADADDSDALFVVPSKGETG